MERPYSAQKLERSLSALRPGELPEVLRLLRDTRELLEETSTKGTFDVLGLYCDWILHPEITGSLVAHNILVLANETLIALVLRSDPNAGPELLSAAVTKALRIDTLRHQLMSLYQSHAIAAPFLNSFAGWHEFLGEIFKEIAVKPLRFVSADSSKPQRGARGPKLLAEMKTKWKAVPAGLVPIPLLVEELTFNYAADAQGDQSSVGRLHWSAAVPHNGRMLWISSPMVPVETAGDFDSR